MTEWKSLDLPRQSLELFYKAINAVGQHWYIKISPQCVGPLITSRLLNQRESISLPASSPLGKYRETSRASNAWEETSSRAARLARHSKGELAQRPKINCQLLWPINTDNSFKFMFKKKHRYERKEVATVAWPTIKKWNLYFFIYPRQYFT